MISKERLTEIVQKSVEDAWYNRRSVNPVKEQTEIITNAIWEQLNEPVVSVNEVEVCPKCHDRGWIYSDDGSTRTVCPCHY